jgi:hypothetical protein
MENEIQENNIKVYEDRVEVVYTSGGVGCLHNINNNDE